MEPTAKNLVRLIELNKRRAELEFKSSVLGQECKKELDEVAAEAVKLASIAIILPNQKKLDEFTASLSTYTPEQMKEAISGRSGKAYETLQERGAIVKANYENRVEIAKLLIEMQKLSVDERTRLAGAISEGVVTETIPLGSVDDAGRVRIARFMRRCGIGCMISEKDLVSGADGWNEVRLLISNRAVWVNEDVRTKLEANLKKTQGISMKVQLRNAERQVLVFNETQEKDFESLQKEYLELLKEQDELLKDFNREES
jgi:hypothetical protein